MDSWLLKSVPPDRKRRALPSAPSLPFNHLQLSIDTARLATATAAEVRTLKATISTFALLPASTPVAQAVLAQIERCATLDGQEKSFQLWVSLVMSLLSADVLSSADKTLLTSRAQGIKTSADLSGAVTECQAWTAFDGRLAINIVGRSSIDGPLGAIVRGLRALSAEIRFRPPAPKKAERRVLAALKQAQQFLSSHS
eukprot:TRINITY_DN34823_c0_g1_i1.p1 TRINITY_DN34823_c0_g1~~TRINITY_DN34823_c0_g1_i1.p1  ORF type:complete len:198 (+),score=22.11 TRINITY_DN34823_c0_g1_i1:29-622(+)